MSDDKSAVEKLADEWDKWPANPTVLGVAAEELYDAIEADRAAPEFWQDRWQEAADQRDQYHAEVARLRAKVARVEKLAEAEEKRVAEFNARMVAEDRRHPLYGHHHQIAGILGVNKLRAALADEGGDDAT